MAGIFGLVSWMKSPLGAVVSPSLAFRRTVNGVRVAKQLCGERNQDPRLGSFWPADQWVRWCFQLAYLFGAPDGPGPALRGTSFQMGGREGDRIGGKDSHVIWDGLGLARDRTDTGQTGRTSMVSLPRREKARRHHRHHHRHNSTRSHFGSSHFGSSGSRSQS